MPYALGAVQVQAGQTYTIPVGSAGTVGAVVCANESPYAVNASISATGAPGQWIVAQTADLIACDVSGFNGTLTFTTDNYLSNAGSAPSFLLYLTAFAPGEAIRGTYPAPLMRLANGAIGVATQVLNDSSAVGTLVVETRPINQTQSFFALYNDGQADWWVLRSDNVAQEVLKVINQAGVKSGQLLFPGGWFSGGAQSVQDDGLGNLTATGLITAGAPIKLAAGNQETGAAIVGGTDAAGAFRLNGVNFKTTLTNAPTSITLTVTSSTNIASIGAQDISKYGFAVQYQATAAAFSLWNGIYVTVGNCLLAVDAAAQTLDHHCDACGHVSLAAPFTALTIQRSDPTSIRGLSLGYACPICGALEAFNLALTAADEADPTPQGNGDYATTRGAQATLIRQLMIALGLALA